MKALHDRPLAAAGYRSYRYQSAFGWVMIGATSAEDALREAERSIGGEADIRRLETWNGAAYLPAIVP